MKSEEAIRILRYEKPAKEYVGNLTEALDKAIEALEKQTPMPVKITTSTKRCGRCNRQLSSIKNAQPSEKYCPRCGQAIDWEG